MPESKDPEDASYTMPRQSVFTIGSFAVLTTNPWLASGRKPKVIFSGWSRACPERPKGVEWAFRPALTAPPFCCHPEGSATGGERSERGKERVAEAWFCFSWLLTTDYWLPATHQRKLNL